MLINFLILIFVLLIFLFKKNKIKDKYLIFIKNKSGKNNFCNLVKYTSSTLPENIKCTLKKNLIYILNYLNKNKEWYISGNEITNVEIRENKSYKNIIVDIFIWDLKKLHYNFIKFNYTIKNNKIFLHSFDLIKDRIKYNNNNNDLDFIRENEYLNVSKKRNQWII